jgi:DNA polymerase V
MKDKIKIFNANAATSSTPIPLHDSHIMAGFPSPADDYVENNLDLNTHLIDHPAATYFVKVMGDSMIDANIFSGDILIVDKSLPIADKKIVIAVIDGEFTVKRIRINDGKIILEANNPQFDNIKIDTSNYELTIFGIVTYIIHKAK